MAATAAFCNSAKKEFLEAVHVTTDVYKIALYTAATAALDKTTTIYSTTGEVTGTGYTAGGVVLTGYTTALTGDVASIDWADPSWASATITADTALIYNSSKTNKALAVLTFTSTTSTNGTFSVQLPSSGVGVMRIA